MLIFNNVLIKIIISLSSSLLFGKYIFFNISIKFSIFCKIRMFFKHNLYTITPNDQISDFEQYSLNSSILPYTRDYHKMYLVNHYYKFFLQNQNQLFL